MIKTSYVLSKRIARGGMAEIYLGKAVGKDAFQRICAIKRILPHFAQDKEFVEMFRDEAHICKRLQHANIVQVFDFTEVEESYALIMEHVDGADMRTLLSACENARIRLSIPMILYVMACTARGLHYAHTKIDEITNMPLGIIHRDVSPQNILISYEGDVKITDFGIASAEDKMTETRPGVVKGKYSYMSPEQVTAKPLDARSDVFSLSIVLWEALAMKRLFTGQTEVETIRKVQNCEINLKLTDLNGEVDDGLEQIVLKGLARDKKKRYQSAAEFEKSLLKYLHSQYPEFVTRELGDFLKEILKKKRDESKDEIKKILTKTDQRKAPNKPEELIQAIKELKDVSKNMPALKIHPTRGIGQKSVAHAEKSVKPKYNKLSASKVNFNNLSSQVIRPYSNLKRKKSSTTKNLIIAAAIAAIGYFSLSRGNNNKMHVLVQTNVDSVRLQLNGKLLKSGSYKKTPLKLALEPGKYDLVVKRPGYKSERIRFQGQAGDSVNPGSIYLAKENTANMIPVSIISDKKLYVNVDSGYARGTTPLKILVKKGNNHIISFAYGPKGNKKAMKCSFRPGKKSIKKSFTVNIIPQPGGRVRCLGKTN